MKTAQAAILIAVFTKMALSIPVYGNRFMTRGRLPFSGGMWPNAGHGYFPLEARGLSGYGNMIRGNIWGGRKMKVNGGYNYGKILGGFGLGGLRNRYGYRKVFKGYKPARIVRGFRPVRVFRGFGNGFRFGNTMNRQMGGFRFGNTMNRQLGGFRFGAFGGFDDDDD